MIEAGLHSTACAICETQGNASELYPANFSLHDFSPAVFSARRLPDRIHYRLVQCNACGLVRSDPVVDEELIAQLYHQSTFDYGSEADNLSRTYGSYLARLNSHGVKKGALLEIGCGNGFFLREALRQGYSDVRGVEPSKAAIAQAAPELRGRIECAMMTRGLFADEFFDAICLFQVLDHLSNPSAILRTCFQMLRPGGLVLCLNHNVRALSAKVMKDRSPIVDIEHTYLYSPETMKLLFFKAGLQVRETAGVWNLYSLGYVARLLPLPAPAKRLLSTVLTGVGLAGLCVKIPLGNLFTIGRKPA